MILSEMISFRPESFEQRDLSKYIQLIQQVYLMLRQSSEPTSNVNNIATCIRQVVLKNDCLEDKNDLLDFFFHCQKSNSNNNSLQKISKKNSKHQKPWIHIVQKKINNIKALYELDQRVRKITLKRGFSSLKIKPVLTELPIQLQPLVDDSTIYVQEDIRLKTLYFFKWCKFIEYGKTIKKLRLKEIDDLRKSLTFNNYAVKFSYFQNWRKISNISHINKKNFIQIQQISKKTLFNITTKKFYSLYEIIKIEQKLCEKIKETILFCQKQNFFKRLAFNSNKQKEKAVRESPYRMDLSLSKIGAQKMRYEFLFFLSSFLGVRPKSKTLCQNLIKSQLNQKMLKQKAVFVCLKNQVSEAKKNIQKVEEMRKSRYLRSNFYEFSKNKQIDQNLSILVSLLKQNKLKNGLNLLSFIVRTKKELKQKGNIFNLQLTESHLFKEQQTYRDLLNHQNPIFESQKQAHLYQLLERNKFKELLETRISNQKLTKMLNQLKNHRKANQELKHKYISIIQNQRKTVIQSLKSYHQNLQAKALQKDQINLIYSRNLVKKYFKLMNSYKFIRLSHSQALQSIEKNIIKPKQLLFGFIKIYEKKSKKDASQKILKNLQKIKLRNSYETCFRQHCQFLKNFKSLEKRSQLQKVEFLFKFLKKNQEEGKLKIQEIKQNVVLKFIKQRFMNNFKSQFQFVKNQQDFYKFFKKEKQLQLIESLVSRKQQTQSLRMRSQCLSKYLGLSLFCKKFVARNNQSIEIEKNQSKLLQFLSIKNLQQFLKSLNKKKNNSDQIQAKIINFSNFIAKNSLKDFIQKLYYQKKHSSFETQKKISLLSTKINFQSFFTKFSHESHRRYLNRWIYWNTKSFLFEKLSKNIQFTKKHSQIVKKIQNYRLINAWQQIKTNIKRETQVLLQKQQKIQQILGYNRKSQIGMVASKFIMVKQAHQSYMNLRNSIKLKHFSKFMRNSLVAKYQRVKYFCAIKSYARNLKLKSLNGLRMMMLRLIDKENRLKSEQELIVKVDKVMYQSRKSNKLTETIQRFNNSLRKDKVTR